MMRGGGRRRRTCQDGGMSPDCEPALGRISFPEILPGRGWVSGPEERQQNGKKKSVPGCHRTRSKRHGLAARMTLID